ncbi:hypothetical protein F4806DRAFT_300598 [Annulohypoxylon nitens]|nr:hypothetical protein F4806DRAFT_300598 [Annulohypoxylon nitens]
MPYAVGVHGWLSFTCMGTLPRVVVLMLGTQSRIDERDCTARSRWSILCIGYCVLCIVYWVLSLGSWVLLRVTVQDNRPKTTPRVSDDSMTSNE